MPHTPYDDHDFFEKYSQMDRSRKGLEAAGEWEALKALLPEFSGKRVLDLGCGYGWHCIYAAEQGAAAVTGIDPSEKMLEVAREKSAGYPGIQYICSSMEEADFAPSSFDVVISSLAFHYVERFGEVCAGVADWLIPGGDFVFSVEHPVFTAQGTQDWYYDDKGNALHWPVDRYFGEGGREAVFLGSAIRKYHRTLTTYLGELLDRGFELLSVVEPQPSARLLDEVPGMQDELRRPMMLLVAARKKTAASAS